MTDGRRGVILGVVLIGLGLLFLAERVVGFDFAEAGWPLFVMSRVVISLWW